MSEHSSTYHKLKKWKQKKQSKICEQRYHHFCIPFQPIYTNWGSVEVQFSCKACVAVFFPISHSYWHCFCLFLDYCYIVLIYHYLVIVYKVLTFHWYLKKKWLMPLAGLEITTCSSTLFLFIICLLKIYFTTRLVILSSY